MPCRTPCSAPGAGWTSSRAAAASVASVTSALQRARSTATAALPMRSQLQTLRALGDRAVADLAHRYATALETGDVEALLAMLTDDATWSMPPTPMYTRGCTQRSIIPTRPRPSAKCAFSLARARPKGAFWPIRSARSAGRTARRKM